MSLLLLRHVHAGDRDAHDGDDRRRPVSTTGLKQALALVDRFSARTIVAICSSPYTRCLQSVEPLAAAHGLVTEVLDELAEGAPFDLVQRFLRQQHRRGEQLGGDVVLCSHGDVIGAVVEHLIDQGVELGTDEVRWQKAST
ncbi:MAG: phosphoglycerate mutase family protein, partial [Nitriliruptor sp.]